LTVRAAAAILLLLAGCSATRQLEPPLPRDAAWVAIGQEPGWRVDIRPDRTIEAIADYGDRRASLPYVRPVAQGSTLEFHAFGGENELRLRIFDRPCADGMSGRPYPATAELELNGRSYRGCAEPVRP
jgi:putative lipoprotein